MESKNMQPLISVIIPVHNTELFLADCLDSVTNQIYNNIEILVVDDDSTDGSKRVIRRYQQRDPRIKYFKTNQHNAALTRHEGIKRSAAEYICFIDSDDVVSSDYVQDLYNALIKHRTSISTAKIATFKDTAYRPISYKSKAATHIRSDLLDFFCKHYYWDYKGDYIPQSINAKMFKKTVFEGIDYSVIKTSILEDNYIAAQIFKNVQPQNIALVDRVLYHYRMNPGSTMSNSLSRKISYDGREINFAQLFDITMDYIRDLFKDNKNIDRCIDKIKITRYLELANSVTEKNMHIDSLESHIKEINLQMEALQSEVNEIKRSKSYKTGRAMAYPLVFIKTLLSKIK